MVRVHRVVPDRGRHGATLPVHAPGGSAIAADLGAPPVEHLALATDRRRVAERVPDVRVLRDELLPQFDAAMSALFRDLARTADGVAEGLAEASRAVHSSWGQKLIYGPARNEKSFPRGLSRPPPRLNLFLT